MKFISFVSVIAIFCLLSLCLTIKRKSKKLKTKSRVHPDTYLKIKNGWLAQCQACGKNFNKKTQKIFKCPHTNPAAVNDCIDCIPKRKGQGTVCNGCFGLGGFAGTCFTDIVLDVPNRVKILKIDNPNAPEDPTSFTVTPKKGTEQDDKGIKEEVKVEEVKPKLKPDDIIDITIKVKSAYLIFDVTYSMNSKKEKLLKDVNELNKGSAITYCFQQLGKPITVGTKQIGIGLQDTDLVISGSKALFKDCLENFQTDQTPYEMIYIIGDGDFDSDLGSLLPFFADKDDNLIKKSTLLHTLTDGKIDEKWKILVEGEAGFDHRVVEMA